MISFEGIKDVIIILSLLFVMISLIVIGSNQCKLDKEEIEEIEVNYVLIASKVKSAINSNTYKIITSEYSDYSIRIEDENFINSSKFNDKNFSIIGKYVKLKAVNDETNIFIEELFKGTVFTIEDVKESIDN